MASPVQTRLTRAGHAALATTYEGGNRRLLEEILPLVEFLEISPDSIAHAEGGTTSLNPEITAELSGARKGVLVHGVGLSIASADGYSERYIQLLDQVFDRFEVAWHSEHLAYTMVEGEALGTMLAPPRTHEMMDILCGRVRSLQERYQVPFLLENVIRLLPDYAANYSEAEFLNELCHRTGCGLVLDAYNLECDQYNLGFEVEAFLRELDLNCVREIHVAGGVRYGEFQLDVHSGRTADSTLALAHRILKCAPQVRAITYEYLKDAIPQLGIETICDELLRVGKDLCE
jgi:uncharacterized protein